jgi:hypothetical protein
VWSTALTEATTGGTLALAIDPRGERAAMGMVRGAVVLIDLRTGETTAVDSGAAFPPGLTPKHTEAHPRVLPSSGGPA